MAKLTSVTIDGFKGQRKTEELTGLDIFTGPNGSGKSSRTEAVSLATLGYIPSGAKQAGEIMKFSVGDNMTVGLGLDTGFSFTREFERKTSVSRKTGEKTISASESLTVTPSKGERTATEKKKRVEEELGNFSIHLDFEEFEKMSAAKRREYLYEFVDGSDELTKEVIAKRLHEADFVNLVKAHNQDAYEVTKKAIDDALDTWPDSMSVEDGILAMTEWIREQRTIWNAKRKDAAGAVRQLAELKNRKTETDREIAENEAELAKLEAELLAAEKEVSSGEEIKKSFDRRNERKAELEKEISELKTEIGPPDTTAIDKQIEELRTKIKKADFETAEIDRQIEEANQKLSKAEDDLRKIRDEKSTLEVSINSLKTAAELASKSGGRCVIYSQIACDKNFAPFLEHVKAKETETQKVINSKEKQISEAQGLVNNIKSEISNLNNQKREKYTVAKNVQESNDEINKQIAALEQKKATLNNEATLKTGKHDLYVSELEKLENEPIVPVPDLDVTKLQIQGLNGQINALKTKIKEQSDSRNTLINMQESMLENAEAEHKYNAMTNLAEELGPKGIQGEILKGGLEPLKEKIQANFDILKIEYPFEFKTESDRGNEIFEFGWVRDGEFVSFDTLSTGERMMVLLAVLTALLQKGNAGVRLLILDEIQSLDDVRFKKTLEGLKALYEADKIDNVLIAGILPIVEVGGVTKYYEPEGWNVRVLGEPEEQVIAS